MHVSLTSPLASMPGNPLQGCRSKRPSNEALPAAAYRTLRQLFHHSVQAEAAGLLTWRELLERLEELADDVLGGNTDEGVVEPPVVVGVRRDVRPFVRVGAQIEELRKPQCRKRLTPDSQRSRGALFLEHELPVVVTQADQFGIIVEVVELLARTLLCLAGEERQQVVAVEMHLEGRVADLHAFEQLPLHVGHARR